jgi:hypothetical protein
VLHTAIVRAEGPIVAESSGNGRVGA